MKNIPVFLAHLPIFNPEPHDDAVKVIGKDKQKKERKKVWQKKIATCRYCGKAFEVVRNNQGYCSFVCQEEMNRQRARERYWEKKGIHNKG